MTITEKKGKQKIIDFDEECTKVGIFVYKKREENPLSIAVCDRENHIVMWMHINVSSVLQFDPGKLVSLPPVFKSDGTITAGNASSISDGAAALLLTSTEYAERNGLPILAYIQGFFDAEQVLLHSFGSVFYFPT